ncbi:hypothetical protein GT037_005486 [Alternaria burnsii]|uniref:Uncharacterized protein n=1 Tax=Alternaria burnsii TaxID=1187904 RepID=A0A8H7EHH5_9PLEO|nr:uncharacterized protein GT037_005486 [Alternaria burnsii]KAF7675981.1 hypothetical protein GT037_005486 [Alternaria burnsii]
MSDSTKNGTLCERCRLLSFDDLALGGQEVVNKDGIARLRFPESRIESRPRSCPPELSFYRLVRLDWKVEDILPDMPRLSHSSQLGCPFCQALLRSLEDAFAKEARTGIIHDGALNLVAYLSLVDEGIGGLIVEATSPRSNQSWHDKRLEIQAFFHIEADSKLNNQSMLH